MFIYGIGITVAQSLGLFTPVKSSYYLLTAYRELLKDSWFIRSFSYSLYIALVSSTVAVLLGSLFAYGLWKMERPGFALLVYKIPLILPHIVAAFFIQFIFSKTGVISSLLHHIGVVPNFQNFPNIPYSSTGIILAYIYKEVPFVMLMQMGIYNRIDRNIVVTAENLGSTPINTYFSVITPYLKGITHTTFIIIFLYSFGAFEIPFIIGGSKPEMISILIYNLYFNAPLNQRPLAMAALVLLFIFAMVFVVLYSYMAKKIDSGFRSI